MGGRASRGLRTTVANTVAETGAQLTYTVLHLRSPCTLACRTPGAGRHHSLGEMGCPEKSSSIHPPAKQASNSAKVSRGERVRQSRHTPCRPPSTPPATSAADRTPHPRWLRPPPAGSGPGPLGCRARCHPGSRPHAGSPAAGTGTGTGRRGMQNFSDRKRGGVGPSPGLSCLLHSLHSPHPRAPPSKSWSR